MTKPVIPDPMAKGFVPELPFSKALGPESPPKSRLGIKATSGTYWLSYSVANYISIADTSARDKTCAVSVVFEGERHLPFNGIRVIILAKRSGLLDRVVSANITSDSFAPSLECKLEELTLDIGVLTDAQLRRFAPWPTLRVLKLHGIQGLTNDGFREFLTSVAKSLVHLSVSNSPMTYKDWGDGHALDDVIPIMEQLRYLALADVHVTSLVISQKRVGEPTCLPGERRTIKIYRATETLRLEHLEEAIAITGWEVVTIVWQTSELDKDLVEKSKASARARGISFTSRIRNKHHPSPSEE
ncbi:hypothetical protein H0H93_011849 [Arthromyces matolae]|nr:hypothetical protein H0H93_011849 [Arthromyces matolae]